MDPLWIIVVELALITALLVIRCEQHNRDLRNKR